jgi:hypothetical protein
MNRTRPLRALLVSAFLLTAAAGSVLAQGKVEVQGGDTYDWGTVSPGQLKTTIVVKNVGSDVLNISRVQPSCGCTSSPIDKNVLQPGETGSINVTLNANGNGPIHKSLTIYSDAPGDTAHMIQLAANIRAKIVYEPSNYFLINEGTVKKASLSTLTIVNQDDKPLTIYPPEFVKGNVKMKFPMKKKVVIKPGARYELKAEVTPSTVGPINGEVKVKTSSVETPEITFNVWGNALEKQVTQTSAH